jgi:hypothetical protein
MLTARCGTADCVWGYQVASACDAQEMDECRDAFRQHCVERHGLSEDDGSCAYQDARKLKLSPLSTCVTGLEGKLEQPLRCASDLKLFERPLDEHFAPIAERTALTCREG